jgi:hypothetical protein
MFLSKEHSDRASDCDGSSIFYRHEGNSLSPLEKAIDSVLTSVGDVSNIVEYWSREHYINIDTHADVDEKRLLHESRILCPKQGHILYLSVDTNLLGPTFIFPNKLEGWGTERSTKTKIIEMITVPALQGRLVRFNGRAMHAVPKPVDRWLLSDVDEKLLREKENDEAQRFTDNKKSKDSIDHKDLRHVLLFNTWDYGPAYVDEDPAFSGDGNDLISQWQSKYGKCAEKIVCNDLSNWSEAMITDAEIDDDYINEYDTIRINLMGSKKRRCHLKPYTKLSGVSIDTIRAAITEPERPSRVLLQNEKV